MSDHLKLTLIWLSGTALTIALCMLNAGGVFQNGSFTPVGPDAFYHSRRILDAVADLSAFYQFDPHIHAPEGSWLTWPWAFDLTAAWMVRLVIAVVPDWQPETVLAYLPVAWILVNVTLVHWIARLLGLSAVLQLIAVLCFALIPQTWSLHQFGRVDHHYMEHTFTLGAVATGLWWFANMESARRAAVLGCVLGLASAFHTSLFVLQLPLSACLLLMWIFGDPLKTRSVAWLGAGLIAGALAATLPSEPLWDGQFTFYTLSGFHLYASAANAVYMVALCRLPRSTTGVMQLGAALLVLLAPLAAPVLTSYSWFSLEYDYLDDIAELRPLLGEGRMPFSNALTLYSGLLLTLPIAALYGVWSSVTKTNPGERYFALFCVFGIVFLMMQVHFHYFGSFVLYLVPLLLIQKWRRAKRWFPGPVSGAAVLGVALIAVMWAPVASLTRPAPIALDMNYYVTRDLYPRLRNACNERPGVVLASLRDGHYIRFHTNCSVVANLMIVTPQHNEKVQTADRLLEMTPSELRDSVPWVDYVLVTRSNTPDAPPDSPTSRQLRHGLPFHLLRENTPDPEGFELLSETTHADGTPAARAYRLAR